MKKLILATLVFFTVNKYYTQTVNTFTANNAQITDTLFSGGIIEANCIHAADTIVADRDIIANENIRVTGNIELGGKLLFPSSTTDSIGMSYYTTTGPGPNPYSIFSLGKQNVNPPVFPTICPNPENHDPNYWVIASGAGLASTWHQTPINAAVKMYVAPWNGFGHIELEGTGTGGDNNALEINYFCGRNTHINRNSSLTNLGGWVRMGRRVSMDAHVDIGDSISGINNMPNNIALNIFTNSGRGIVLKTTHAPTNLLNVVNPSSPTNMLFTLRGDGVVQIGKNNQAVNVPLLVYGNGANEAFEIRNPANEQINFRVKTNGFVYAREIEVTAGTFPDYVFDASYKLMKLQHLDSYIKKNKRLPGFENAEYYIKNGIKTSEMFIKQQEKIEELTLYIIELNKKIEALEAKIK